MLDAYLVIAAGCGWLAGQTVGYVLGRWARTEAAQDAPFPITWGGVYEQEERWSESVRIAVAGSHGFAAAPNTGKSTNTAIVPVVSRGLNLTPSQKAKLINLILNSPASTNGLPMTDIPLTYTALKRYGIGRKPADRLRADVLRLRFGWQDGAGTVHLNRHKAREWVEKARRTGVIGTHPPEADMRLIQADGSGKDKGDE